MLLYSKILVKLFTRKLCIQYICMVFDVVTNESGDKVVAVIVPLLHSKYHWQFLLTATLYKISWKQLALWKETILFALIYENIGEWWATVVLYNFCGIPTLPSFLV